MFQRTHLFEHPLSLKILLTSFIVFACLAAFSALCAFYYAFGHADGEPGVSFADIEKTVFGSETSPLNLALLNPHRYGLGGVKATDLELLRLWCERGAPHAGFGNVARILKGSAFDRRVGSTFLLDEYSRVRALALSVPPMTAATKAQVISVYFCLAGFFMLILGMLFLRTSLFERKKIFFVMLAFLSSLVAPAAFLLSGRAAALLYISLLAGLVVLVCLAMFAMLALYDLWVRKPAS